MNRTTATRRRSASKRAVYCTVVAQNYLPQALALYSSIREVEPERDFCVLVIDGDRSDLEAGRPRLKVATTKILGLSERAVLDLAAIYDVVEFSTSVKPLFLKALLTKYDQAVYLDPDTFLVSPLLELEDLMDEWGVVLTPHFLEQIPPDASYISEVHSLTVGIHNLGFCAVGSQSVPFLDWWWGHLERECMIYPLLGIFVDQKWTDVGANLFNAHSLMHYGYNIGPWNLHERNIRKDGDVWSVGPGEDLVRFIHFSGFDPKDPEAISVRLNFDMRDVAGETPALTEISHVYASRVLDARSVLGPAPAYGFARDSAGKALSKRVRRAYRKALLTRDSAGEPPSPFISTESRPFKKWKRKSWKTRIAISMGDAAIAAKYVFPDEYSRMKSRSPQQFSRLRGRLLNAGRMRR